MRDAIGAREDDNACRTDRLSRQLHLGRDHQSGHFVQAKIATDACEPNPWPSIRRCRQFGAELSSALVTMSLLDHPIETDQRFVSGPSSAPLGAAVKGLAGWISRLCTAVAVIPPLRARHQPEIRGSSDCESGTDHWTRSVAGGPSTLEDRISSGVAFGFGPSPASRSDVHGPRFVQTNHWASLYDDPFWLSHCKRRVARACFLDCGLSPSPG